MNVSLIRFCDIICIFIDQWSYKIKKNTNKKNNSSEFIEKNVTCNLQLVTIICTNLVEAVEVSQHVKGFKEQGHALNLLFKWLNKNLKI